MTGGNDDYSRRMSVCLPIPSWMDACTLTAYNPYHLTPSMYLLSSPLYSFDCYGDMTQDDYEKLLSELDGIEASPLRPWSRAHGITHAHTVCEVSPPPPNAKTPTPTFAPPSPRSSSLSVWHRIPRSNSGKYA